MQANDREVDFCPFRGPDARLPRSDTISLLAAEINPTFGGDQEQAHGPQPETNSSQSGIDGRVARCATRGKSKVVKVNIKGDSRYDQHAKDRARKAEHDALLMAPAGTPLPQTLAYDADVSRLQLEEHQKPRNELLLSGVEGTATVLSIQEMGEAVPPLVGYVVKVEVRPRLGGAPFTMEMDAWLDLKTHPIAPGSTVEVRYDPQNFFDIILLET